MGKRRIIILGAGLAGLSAAWHLQKKGVECLVFEKENEPGGLCRSKKINGFTFDFSGHLLHFRHAHTFNFVKRLLGDNLKKHKRSAWVHAGGKYIPYPFQANLYGLPARAVKECLLGFIRARKKKIRESPQEQNFLDWIYRVFGDGIAKHFMIPYNTKFWTVPPQEMTCEWLDGYIPVPSLSEAVRGAVSKSKKQYGYNTHFWYPKKGGIAELPKAIASEVKNIYYNKEVTRIDLDKREIQLSGVEREKFDCLVSTLPLPEMARLIKNVPRNIALCSKKLKWNSILALNVGMSARDDSIHHWAYFSQQDVSFFRVGFFHNFSPAMAPVGKGALYADIAYSQERKIDKQRLVLKALADLKKVELQKSANSFYLQGVTDIKYGYPIYDQNYCYAREKIMKYLRLRNVLSCGRYGDWKYMSMEKVLLGGMETAGRIC